MSKVATKPAGTQGSPPSFRPRTALGRRLWEIRQAALASSACEPLLDWDGVARELAERRGEPED